MQEYVFQGHPSVPEVPPSSGSRPQPVRRIRDTSSFILGLVLLVGGVGLAAAGTQRQHATPGGAVARWRDTLAAGNISALHDDERLGTRTWIDATVHDMGEAEYTRVLGIYRHAEELGQQEYSRLQTAVQTGGAQAFEALPEGNQQAIRRRSYDTWVFQHGAEADPTDVAVAGTWQVLSQLATPAMVQQLGTSALSADEQSLLGGRAADDPAVDGDPMLRRLATRRTHAGTAMFDSARQRVWTAGERAFRRLDYGQRVAINGASLAQYELEQGLASLTPADRQKASAPGVFTDPDAAAALKSRLGLELLPTLERSQIAGEDRAAFVAAHDRYVHDTGRRLAHDRLIAIFAGSEYTVEDSVVHGRGGRDVLQRESARWTLRWARINGDPTHRPRTLELAWTPASRDWRIRDIQWERVEPASGSTGGTAPPTLPSATTPGTATDNDNTNDNDNTAEGAP